MKSTEKARYSIFIRTLGKGGDKYQALLKSIATQTMAPEEVVVVLPFGFTPPIERLGYERFSYCEKGMVRQRLFAIANARTEYALLLDDDVEFEPEFVEKEFRAMNAAGATCCIAKMYNNAGAGRSRLKVWLNRVVGSEIHRDIHDTHLFKKINKAGGFVVNTGVLSAPVYSQTGHGSNCLCRVSDLRATHFEDELWLENCGYALPDDQVMFYKLYLQGTKIAVCMDTYFRHLDAASTNDGKRYLRIAQAKASNYPIFWYRFIYKRLRGWRRLPAVAAIVWRTLAECLLYMAKCHNVASVKSVTKGWSFAIKYISRLKS